MKFEALTAKDKKTVFAVIETPCKSRNKYSYDKKNKFFKLSKVLPAGLAFPCDMGFIPNTEGEDGDPLDILILMDELTFPGCVVECRLIGIIKAIQKEKGKDEVENDRLVGVPVEMSDLNYAKDITDVSKNKLNAIVNFFEYYNEMEERKFNFKKFEDHKSAYKTIEKHRK